MSDYQVPLEEIKFVLNDVLAFDSILELPAFSEVTPDLVDAIIDQAGRFCSEVVAPTNRLADRDSARLDGDRVVVTPGLDEVYRHFIGNGWASLCGDVDYGGQGMPHLLGYVFDEMLQTANVAFSLLPLLSKGVATALGKYGKDSQKQTYLTKLTGGEWSGTMNLTEPQAGSDLAAVKTRAVPSGDHYLINGSKIFITWGDHELADNIIHLVLARLPDAPEGVKGISMFIVPKYLVDEEGNRGERNDVFPVAVEHKLGIHGSPTCALNFGGNIEASEGAVGYLVGEPNQGLAYMFTMMNHARLAVGLQGVSVSERAYQQARAYAKERVQGGKTIIQHPDVRRMLLQMKALTEAGRVLAYAGLEAYDLAARGAEDIRQYQERRVGLLTPIIKGWCTETVNEVTSLGIQVHGGMGYIEETGAAQHYRDARILAIYEGTNGIQALDLIGRKFLMNRGRAMQELIADLSGIIPQCREQGLDDLARRLEAAYSEVAAVSALIPEAAAKDADFAGAVAFNFLMMIGIAAAGFYMAKAAAVASEKSTAGSGNPAFLQAKQQTARFYIEQILPRALAHAAAIKAGSTTIMALDESRF